MFKSKEAEREYKKRYYAIPENKKHKSEYDKIYREQNNDKRLEYGKKYYLENKEKFSAKNKERREGPNRQKILDMKKDHYFKNKELCNIKSNEWAKNNPKERREIANRYINRQVKYMTDRYIVTLFNKNKKEEIPDWLIELKRSSLKLKRRMEEYNGKTNKS